MSNIKTNPTPSTRELELDELVRAFIDATVLPGHVVTQTQWERACLLCGRACTPFMDAARAQEILDAAGVRTIRIELARGDKTI